MPPGSTRLRPGEGAAGSTRRSGLACRIITPEEEMSTKSPKEEQHWYKFQHPCFWCLKDGHPELGPPGMKCPLHPRLGMTGRGGVCPPVLAEMAAKHQCTNMDPDHRRCFRHPVDDFVAEEVVDETPDELDLAVVRDEPSWSSPDVGSVSEEEAMEAKAAAAPSWIDARTSEATASSSNASTDRPSCHQIKNSSKETLPSPSLSSLDMTRSSCSGDSS